jgi:hypothetical protein
MVLVFTDRFWPFSSLSTPAQGVVGLSVVGLWSIAVFTPSFGSNEMFA